LDVHHNKIRQIDPNSFEIKLYIKCLKIDDNGLKNFHNIEKLIKLQHLFANSNKITEFCDVEKLTNLPYLKELELTGNIIHRKPGYRISMIKKLPGLLFLDGRVIYLLYRKSHQMNESSPPTLQ
jgi:Leucine-rich repeat (LRR) protein